MLMICAARERERQLKTFREKSFLAHIDCSQIEKWPQMGEDEISRAWCQ